MKKKTERRCRWNGERIKNEESARERERERSWACIKGQLKGFPRAKRRK